MVEEMEYLHKYETWDLVEKHNGRKPIGIKWVFKKNLNASCQLQNFKSPLVVKGYSQVKGVDFGDILSLISKLTSIRVIMCLATTFDI
jgi:hypothetical protein